MLRFLLFICSIGAVAQTPDNELTFNEYLGYVKKFHPAVKSAGLEINAAQASLMTARGAFDPKIEVDFDRKEFKDKNYYAVLNSSFKIPTWYGIEVKAAFDNSEGVFLNPQNVMPNQGLTSLGVTIPVGQGLLINQRMADLRKAKIQLQLSQAEQKLRATEVLYEASLAYFNWKKTYDEVQLYTTYLRNAEIRFKGVKGLIENGDKPAVDSVEAGIIVRNRKLSLTEATLKLAKARLELSNFLWLDNSVPMELQERMVPEANLSVTLRETLSANDLMGNLSTENHPKINALNNKLSLLDVERRFKSNMLLPKLDVGYHYLSEPSAWNQQDFTNYKVGVNFYFPLFLRKERGGLQLTKLKIQDTQYELNLTKVELSNKIKAGQTEIISLEDQRELVSELVSDYQTMLSSEERLFSFGESSIFLLNTRENNLVSAQLQQISLENRYQSAFASLFRTLANPE